MLVIIQPSYFFAESGCACSSHNMVSQSSQLAGMSSPSTTARSLRSWQDPTKRGIVLSKWFSPPGGITHKSHGCKSPSGHFTRLTNHLSDVPNRSPQAECAFLEVGPLEKLDGLVFGLLLQDCKTPIHPKWRLGQSSIISGSRCKRNFRKRRQGLRITFEQPRQKAKNQPTPRTRYSSSLCDGSDSIHPW